MKKSKPIILLFLLLAVLFSMAGCDKDTLNFDDLEITVSDLNDVRAGEFSVRYYIDKLDDYQKELGVVVSVSCVDDEGERIAVTNNRATLANNKIYYFTVTASAGGVSKQKTYTVVTERTIMTVTFSSGDYKNFTDFTRTVTFGQTLANIPDVPDYEVADTETTIKEVTEKKWSKSDFSDIRKNETVYAVYTVKETLRKFTVTFDAGEGTCGTESRIFSCNDTYGTGLPRPEAEGKTFFSWYFDDSFTRRVTAGDVITADATLHAKYVTEDDNVSPLSLFSFRLFSNFGLGYAVSAANYCTANSGASEKNLPASLVIPKLYNGYPVVAIDSCGFQFHTEVSSVVIPETIIELGPYAFDSCTALSTVDFRTNEISSVASGAFGNCTSLRSITLPQDVTAIGTGAFGGCTLLETVTFSCPQLIRVGEKAFYNCTALRSLTFNFDVPPIVGQKAFYRKNKITGNDELLQLTLYVPASSLAAYSVEYRNDTVAELREK